MAPPRCKVARLRTWPGRSWKIRLPEFPLQLRPCNHLASKVSIAALLHFDNQNGMEARMTLETLVALAPGELALWNCFGHSKSARPRSFGAAHRALHLDWSWGSLESACGMDLIASWGLGVVPACGPGSWCGLSARSRPWITAASFVGFNRVVVFCALCYRPHLFCCSTDTASQKQVR